MKPFNDLTEQEQELAIEKYVSERMEDSEWVFNALRDATRREWEQDDENYTQFFEDDEE